ncbi:Glucose dehydrogenase [acceptor] [Zootermopsis nevadensis]|uniref:Glucose dehydrogenase [acceptor] n=1 Tax=Zootermopsis nevadensis TaxID=136037 RepID=A0A067QZI1_ZOONE|nr:Glucose dehydrogenase [acceptor] [Zootermopsis nevadensis]
MEEACTAGSHWTSASSCTGTSGVSGVGTVLFTSLITTLMESQRQLGNPDDYPDDATSHLLDEYDFIVVGAGSAGAVVASRLSEVPHWKVLLLEAGGDPTPTSDIPSLSLYLQKTDIDWQYQTEPEEGMCQGFRDKRCYWPRGKVLGGSSVLNYMIYVRGMKGDYDAWSKAGNNGWSYEDVLPYFKKSQDMTSETLLRKDSNGDTYHARGGPLTLEEYERTEFGEIILQAAKELGYENLDDLNGKHQLGFANVFGTLRNGTRPALGPTQPPLQWVPGSFPGGKAGRGVMLTTHPHLVPRSRKRGAIPPLTPNAYMAYSGTNFTFTFITFCKPKATSKRLRRVPNSVAVMKTCLKHAHS